MWNRSSSPSHYEGVCEDSIQQSHTFALSLSKGNSWFDKLTMNGFHGLLKHPLKSMTRLGLMLANKKKRDQFFDIGASPRWYFYLCQPFESPVAVLRGH